MRAAQGAQSSEQVTQAWDIIPPWLQWDSQQSTGKMGVSKPQGAGYENTGAFGDCLVFSLGAQLSSRWPK